MSNIIRRRVEPEEEEDPYLKEEFMQPIRRSRRIDPDDADEFAGDPLWDKYRVRPDLPLADKIEILVLQYRLTNFEISELLGHTEDALNDLVMGLEKQWRQIGEPMSGEDKELERGKQIRRLERFNAYLDQQLADNRDPRLMTLQLNALKELTMLKNLTADKVLVKEEEPIDDFEAVIKVLDPEKLKALHTHLTQS